jgi:hypothetical protein
MLCGILLSGGSEMELHLVALAHADEEPGTVPPKVQNV